MRQTIRYTLIFLSIVLAMSGCTVQKNPVSGNNRLMAYDWEQEIEIGRSVDKEIVAQYGLYDDEEVTTYVAELSEKILAESHMRREDTEPKFKETEFFFKVLDSPVVNAFALPGGYVYFTRGLMAHLNNEAQLSVVIGHEIGHVAARHASQRAFQQQLGQIAVIGGSVLGQELLGLPGGSIMDLSSQAAQLIFLSYGRDAERESDRLGVEYAARTGYEASEGAAFFTSLKRISEQSGQSIPTMLSTHPDPGEREQTIPKLAQNWEEKGYQQTEKNRERYLEILDGMIFGENPRNGFFRDNLFLHPDLAFQFPVPAGWQTINQPQQVVLVSPNEDAVAIFTIDSEASSPQQSVQEIISQEGITVNSQQASQTSSGLPGYSADVTITQEQGRLRAIIHALEYEERIYRFINYTSAGQFETYGETLRSVPLGFSELTDPEILNIEPVRIQLVEADRTDQFKNFLPDQHPMDITPEDVAILNQVSMEDQIEQGTKIKLPVQ
ncbi:MAG: M48 family metalloprotease [Bacteroidetes bacterium]|jgi:predicted Zn-dependent protease|nr:M48 family metalloprotease [Bacteroidota bacterium]